MRLGLLEPGVLAASRSSCGHPNRFTGHLSSTGPAFFSFGRSRAGYDRRVLIDARNAELGDPVRADVCIIGAGAAGITLARELGSERRTVCLLESGGLAFNRAVQSLYEGRAEGQAVHRAYLRTSRLRYFGGTTNHWSGWCRPLDDIDFEPRPWLPHSGWPITKMALAPYYDRAAELVEIEPFDDALDEGHGPEGAIIFPEHDAAVVTKRFHFSPPTRFGTFYRRELARADTTTVLLHANVIDLEANEAGTRIRRVRAATLTGRQLSVEANVYVLAAGAIENTRLLLVSDTVQTAGLGNQHDLVGRFFMDHQEVGTGYLVLTDHMDALAAYQGGRAVMSVLALSREAQRRHKLLNVSVSLVSGSLTRRSAAGGLPLGIGPGIARIDRLDGGSARAPSGSPHAYARSIARAETSPNPESRVTLDEDVDALGLRRARLQWKLTDDDRLNIWRSMEVIAQELARTRRGRVLFDEDESDPWLGWQGGSHHMGTTRMNDDPQRGVVDRNGRVHGLTNLYISGSSIFPTVGFANPTLTIVALTLRLADHLVAELDRV